MSEQNIKSRISREWFNGKGCIEDIARQQAMQIVRDIPIDKLKQLFKFRITDPINLNPSQQRSYERHPEYRDYVGRLKETDSIEFISTLDIPD